MEKISVIIPVYNSEKQLEKLIKSLKAQTIFHSIEYIFIDDGSTDTSYNIIKRFQEQNIQNVLLQKIDNSGVSKARNIGMKLSREEYITFVDSDDYLESDYFERLLIEMENTRADLVCSGFTFEYPNKKVVRKSNKRYNIFHSNIMKEFFIGKKIDPQVTNKLFKRELISELFNEEISIGEDKLFLYHYLKKCEKISIIPYSGYYYVMNDLSAMNKEFSNKKLAPWKIITYMTNDIMQDTKLKKISCWVQSNQVDVACRIYCEMIRYNKEMDFNREYMEVEKCIKGYSFFKKLRYSSLKHFIAYVFTRISPKLYLFVKYDLKMQYRK